MEKNLIYKKSYDFAVEVYKHIVIAGESHHLLFNSFLQSVAKIALNIKKAVYEESTEAFVVKMKIALENARETSYWFDLLEESDNFCGLYVDERKWKTPIDEIIETLETIVENEEKIEIAI